MIYFTLLSIIIFSKSNGSIIIFIVFSNKILPAACGILSSLIILPLKLEIRLVSVLLGYPLLDSLPNKINNLFK